MTTIEILQQLLNGLGFGMILFLMASGLTLVLGIMNFVNLAHGSLYMVGAFVAAVTLIHTHSFIAAVVVGVIGGGVAGVLLELLARRLYGRGHLDQVLFTFGVLIAANEAARIIWGAAPMMMNLPQALSGAVSVLGVGYPSYRLVVIGVSAVVALGLYLLIAKTRLGMLIRAGASDRIVVMGLGVNIRLLDMGVFALSACFAALAGILAGPIFVVEVGMGDNILILALVVIVVGGIGSVLGALIAALLIGVVDTFGQVLLPAGAGDIIVYLLMAAVLLWHPQGLFAGRR